MLIFFYSYYFTLSALWQWSETFYQFCFNKQGQCSVASEHQLHVLLALRKSFSSVRKRSSPLLKIRGVFFSPFDDSMILEADIIWSACLWRRTTEASVASRNIFPDAHVAVEVVVQQSCSHSPDLGPGQLHLKWLFQPATAKGPAGGDQT